jgi:hypothetical protein
MSQADELYAEAERLERKARHNDEVAADLRSEARLLPYGVEAARRSIDPSVWESPSADRTYDMVTNGADAVHAGAGDLQRVVRELEQEADDLRDQAHLLRRRADALDGSGCA